MFNTLYRKLVAVLVAFAFLMAIMFVLVMQFSHDVYHLEAQQNFNKSLAQRLVAESGFRGTEHDPNLRAHLQHFAAANPEIDIYLLDASGTIKLHSLPLTHLPVSGVDPAPIARFLAPRARLPIYGDNPRTPEHRKIFSAAPLTFSSGSPGYLYVVLNGRHEDENAALRSGYVMRETIGLAAGGILLAALIGLFLINLITRPLRQLTAAMDAFRNGHVARRVAQSGAADDEVARLGTAFNAMADQINQQVAELHQKDGARREFLANISHDLRTPLASLQAHLETLLLRKPAMSPDEQNAYLEVAAKQTARLGNLIAKLFELAKLDGAHFELAPEPFSLAELLQDVAQKFELTAAQHDVRIEMRLPERAPFVLADLGLVERALENLIDNALRYTPSAGTVTLALTPADGAVIVSVSDTGPGISPADLPHIFERFYRGDKCRKEACDNAGLGLAIVKRIVELHGAHIQVDSVPGQGTSFSFALPMP